MLQRIWREDEGVLTFEWIMLTTLLVIGTIGGVAGIRDAVLHESQGIIGAMVSLDQSYVIVPPLAVGVDALTPTGAGCTSTASFSSFFDSATWANGRLSPAQLFNIAQPNVSSGSAGLCGLP
jgi:hypothetical protein